MRVIGGLAKGRRLKRVPGDTTRPVMDRVKESLFNILAGHVRGSRWLDLFAGTGQVGIEALSRGADTVVFVDNARQAIRTIRANLALTELEDGARVIQQDAFVFLRETAEAPFDVIYVAPPQYQDLWLRALTSVDDRPDDLLAPGGLVVVQIDPREFTPPDLKVLVLEDQRRYGNTQLNFYAGARASADRQVPLPDA